MRIDREEVLTALRGLVPDGGALILRGDDEAGREQAMELVDEFLRSFHYWPVVVNGRKAPLTVRTALLRSWQSLANDSRADHVEDWLSRSLILTLAQIVDEVGEVASGNERNAIIIQDVDFHQPLLDHQLPFFVSLANRAGCPVVVSSRAETRTDWTPIKGNVIDLRSFTEEDVRACLNAAPELGDKTVGELEELLARASAGAVGESISPLTAYTTLMTWSAA